jgi:hypothetical protein
VITYHGGQDADYLTRLDVTVISSDGRSNHASAVAPPIGHKITISGSGTKGRDHVVVIGTSTGGGQFTILDTNI